MRQWGIRSSVIVVEMVERMDLTAVGERNQQALLIVECVE